MYLGSFLRNIFKPKNILATVYMIANAVIIFFIFSFFNLFKIAEQNNQIYNGLIGLGINFVCMMISLSPLGEMILRLKMRVVRVAETAENAPLLALFNDVYKEAQTNSSRLSKKVKLYYSNSQEVNAYALGHRTMIVTQGMLSCGASDSQIRGVFAHEFGHLSNGDSDMTLAINVSNVILFAAMLIFTLISKLIEMIMVMITKKNAVGVAVNFVFSIIIFITYTLWIKLGVLLVNATSRKSEYKADLFAVDCNEGEGMYSFLDKVEPVKVKSSPLAILGSTHPDTVNRLERIKATMETREKYNGATAETLSQEQNIEA